MASKQNRGLGTPPNARGVLRVGIGSALNPSARGRVPLGNSNSVCISKTYMARKKLEESGGMEHGGRAFFGVPYREEAELISKYRATAHCHLPVEDTSSMSPSHVMVCVRKRPLTENEIRKQTVDVVTILSRNHVVLHQRARNLGGRMGLNNHGFNFHRIFGVKDGDPAVYNQAVKPLLTSVLRGNGVGTWFAYGEVGSGKTHTMERMMLSAAEDVWKQVKRYRARKFKPVVSVTFVEVWGAKVASLLDTGMSALSVLEDDEDQVKIKGLEEKISGEGTELTWLTRLIKLGNATRSSGKRVTHAVFKIAIKVSDRHPPSKLYFVDLAGIGSAEPAGGEGAKVLPAVRRCILVHAKQDGRLPYRDSVVTKILKDAFLKSSKICLLATVNPTLDSTMKSREVLEFAESVAKAAELPFVIFVPTINEKDETKCEEDARATMEENEGSDPLLTMASDVHPCQATDRTYGPFKVDDDARVAWDKELHFKNPGSTSRGQTGRDDETAGS